MREQTVQQGAVLRIVQTTECMLRQQQVYKTTVHWVNAADNIAGTEVVPRSTDCILCVPLDQIHAVHLKSLPA